MKSTDGVYYQALDHVRAIAVFLVFFWHFLGQAELHSLPGTFSFPPNALLAQGHTGVAIFMVLSGYLFAKLTQGKDIAYGAFLWNRFLRLAPLMALVIVFHTVYWAATGRVDTLPDYFRGVAEGLVMPTLPNGGWSITAEMHFYLLFPLILWAERKRPFSSLTLIALALSIRAAIGFWLGAERIFDVAYWTIIGRIDQFVIGILLARHGHWLTRDHGVAAAALLLWIGFWYWFARQGGLYHNGHPWLWLVIPTLEGAAYGILIAWYDRWWTPSRGPIARGLAAIGTWSYSIYLLHFFLVGKLYLLAVAYAPTRNFYGALALAIPGFLAVAGVAALSYRFFESRFLRYRRPYLRPAATASPER